MTAYTPRPVADRLAGLWIPRQILLDRSLSPSAKLLLAEIGFLQFGEGGCFASDAYLGQLFGIEAKTVSNLISQLRARGYVKTVRHDGRRRWLEVPAYGKADSGSTDTLPENGKAATINPGSTLPENGNIEYKLGTSVGKETIAPPQADGAPSPKPTRDTVEEAIWREEYTAAGRGLCAFTAYGAQRAAAKRLRSQGATDADFRATFRAFISSPDAFAQKNCDMLYACTKGWHLPECVKARRGDVGETPETNAYIRNLAEKYK